MINKFKYSQNRKYKVINIYLLSFLLISLILSVFGQYYNNIIFKNSIFSFIFSANYYIQILFLIYISIYFFFISFSKRWFLIMFGFYFGFHLIYYLFQNNLRSFFLSDLNYFLVPITGFYIAFTYSKYYILNAFYKLVFWGLIINIIFMFIDPFNPFTLRNSNYEFELPAIYIYQYLLYPSLYLVLNLKSFSKKKTFIIILALILLIIEQFIFQKRLPFIKCILIVLLPVIVNFKLYAKIVFSILFTLIVLFFQFETIGSSFIDRYRQTELSMDKDRMGIALIILEENKNSEIIFGSGLGAATTNQLLHWNSSDKASKDGVYVVEAGWANIYWKGGLILLLFYIIIPLIITYLNRKKNNYNRLDYYFIVIFTISFSLESYIGRALIINLLYWIVVGLFLYKANNSTNYTKINYNKLNEI